MEACCAVRDSSVYWRQLPLEIVYKQYLESMNQLIRDPSNGRSKPLLIKIATRQRELITYAEKASSKANVKFAYENAWLDQLVRERGYEAG